MTWGRGGMARHVDPPAQRRCVGRAAHVPHGVAGLTYRDPAGGPGRPRPVLVTSERRYPPRYSPSRLGPRRAKTCDLRRRLHAIGKWGLGGGPRRRASRRGFRWPAGSSSESRQGDLAAASCPPGSPRRRASSRKPPAPASAGTASEARPPTASGSRRD